MTAEAKRTFFLRAAGGGAVGAANGLFGGGGGMIAVPLLERIEGRGTAAAHATAIGLPLSSTISPILSSEPLASLTPVDPSLMRGLLS